MNFFQPLRRLVFLWMTMVLGLHSAGAKSPWIKTESGHFTVLSQGSEAQTKKWAAELAQFQRGLQSILPVPAERLRPVTVILFKTDRDFRPFKPREKGKPQNVAGLFARTQDSQAIALSLDYDPDELRRVVYHEAVHWHTAAADQSLPPWLEEGLAEVYSTFRTANDGAYTFGDVMQSHLRFLLTSKEMPLEKTTGVSRDSLSYNDGNRATLFYAQSWAFVHYLLFGEDTPGMQSVVKYLAASERASSMEAAFMEAFGGSYAALDRKLATYLRGGRYHTYTYRQREVMAASQWTISPVQEGEVQLALGTLLLGIADRRDDALGYLHQAAALRPERPEVWQVLGEAALLANNHTEASDYFGRSVERGSTSYFAHYGLGVSRMQGEFSGGSVYSSGEAIYAARHFRRAIELNPHFLPAYESLGGVLPALDKVEAGDRAILERGWRFAPNRGPIDLGLAAFDFKTGARESARLRLDGLRRDGTQPPEIVKLAITMLKDDDWGQFGVRMEKLFKDRKYAEVVAAIDASRSEFTEPRYAQTLGLNRDRAENYRILSEAVEFLNARKYPAARPLLERLREHPDLNLRSEARRLLSLLDKNQR